MVRRCMMYRLGGLVGASCCADYSTGKYGQKDVLESKLRDTLKQETLDTRAKLRPEQAERRRRIRT